MSQNSMSSSFFFVIRRTRYPAETKKTANPFLHVISIYLERDKPLRLVKSQNCKQKLEVSLSYIHNLHVCM